MVAAASRLAGKRMERFLLILGLALNSICFSSPEGAEAANASPPTRFSEIVNRADSVVVDFGEYGHPWEVRIVDRHFIEAIAQVFADATYSRRDHSLNGSFPSARFSCQAFEQKR